MQVKLCLTLCCYRITQSHIVIKFSHLVACLVEGVCGRQEGVVGTLREVQAPLAQGNSRLARFPEKLDAPLLPRQHHKRRGSQLGIRSRDDRGRSGFPRPPSGGRGQGPCSYRSQTDGHRPLVLRDVGPVAAR